MEQFTASEVRSFIEQSLAQEPPIKKMLSAYADRLEEEEKAVPVVWVSPDDLANPYFVGIGAAKEAHQDLGRHYTQPLYTHPVPADAERLAEALRWALKYIDTPEKAARYKYRGVAAIKHVIEGALTAHSAQAQPPATRLKSYLETLSTSERGVAEMALSFAAPAASVTDGFLRHVAAVCRGAVENCRPKASLIPEDPQEHNGGLYLNELTHIAGEIDRMLAAQPRVTDVKVRASALLDLLESDFGQSGRDVRVEAIACELCAASLPDASWFSSEVCEARNQWAQRHEMNWLETDENHPDDFIGKWIRDKLLAAQENPNG